MCGLMLLSGFLHLSSLEKGPFPKAYHLLVLLILWNGVGKGLNLGLEFRFPGLSCDSAT